MEATLFPFQRRIDDGIDDRMGKKGAWIVRIGESEGFDHLSEARERERESVCVCVKCSGGGSRCCCS